MKNPAIQVEHVAKTFKTVKAVSDLSFQVETAQCFGLLGPNGAGKSTMMNMIYGKTRRDVDNGGLIRVFDCDPNENALMIKFLSGIVPQENNLDIELQVLQNLLIYSRFYGISRKAALPRIESLLAFMELSEKIHSRIRDLSGGMQRRLILARALLNNPKLLILDEPTTGLDPQVRQLIWDKLRLLKQEGVTILLCTHYMEEAFQLCDQLIIMNGGLKVLEGNPASLIREHMEPWVLEIFGADLLEDKTIDRAIHLEKTAHRMFLYSKDLGALQSIRNGLPAGNYFLRQSNLEDLFLKTTGRKLNE